jgi:hypothetical protein
LIKSHEIAGKLLDGPVEYRSEDPVQPGVFGQSQSTDDFIDKRIAQGIDIRSHNNPISKTINSTMRQAIEINPSAWSRKLL